jgi:hypothetical protein
MALEVVRMKLRDEKKLKEKISFQLDTRHLLYLVLWSIALSGAIFYTGLFVGQKGQEGVAQYTLGAARADTAEKSKEALLAEPLISSWSFVNTLTRDPDEKKMDDAALEAIAGLREDVLSKVEKADEVTKQELAEKLFSPPDAADRPARPDQVLAETSGIHSREPSLARKLGLAPLFEAGAEREPSSPVLSPEGEGSAQGGEAAAEREPPSPTLPPGGEGSAQGRLVGGGAERLALLRPSGIVGQVPSSSPGGEGRAPGRTAAEETGGAEKGFAVQAKAFRDRAEAKVFRDYLKHELGRSQYKPFVETVDLGGKGTWYRVRIGAFKTRLEAEQFKQLFEKKLGLETFLVSL